MLIRVRGYHSGAKEYLEDGQKQDRSLHRDELDDRLILSGDLDITKMIYESINSDADRYYSVVIAFKENYVSEETLYGVADDFKKFMSAAFKDDEMNFYAEAHLPKIKFEKDKLTGEMIERRPHIHIIIPKVNLLNGNIIEPLGYPYEKSLPYVEAIQESMNRKYGVESPRDNIREDASDYSSVLSRHKGDVFRGKNKDAKKDIYSRVVDENIRTIPEFKNLLSQFGDVRVRNPGKVNEYFAVRLPGDDKYTNLKSPLYSKAFIEKRQLAEPLTDKEINKRLEFWHSFQSRQVKYIDRAGPSLRNKFNQADEPGKRALLRDVERDFYKRHTNKNERVYSSRIRSGSDKPGITYDDKGKQHTVARAQRSVSLLSTGPVDARPRTSPGVLQNDVRVHVGQSGPGPGGGLRRPVRRDGGRAAPRPRNPGNGKRPGAVPVAGAGHVKPASGAARLTRPDVLQRPRGIPGERDIAQRSARLAGRIPVRQRSVPVPAASVAEDLLARAKEREHHSAELEKLKTALYPPRVLAWAAENKNVRQKYTWFRNKNGQYRINAGGRSLSYPDFMRRELNMRLDESVGVLSRLYAVQKAEHRKEKAELAARTPGVFSWPDFQKRWLPERRKLIATGISERRRQFVSEARICSLNCRERQASVYLDKRLSANDKRQLHTIHLFEAIKERQRLQSQLNTDLNAYRSEARLPFSELKNRYLINKENLSMSMNIKRDEEENTIAPGWKQLLSQDPAAFRQEMGFERTVERVKEEKEREGLTGAILKRLDAEDFYHQSRSGGKVDFVEKMTDKTHFTDHGTYMSVKPEAIKSDSTAVALELAVAKFGSTLKIKGSDEFKEQIIQAAVEKNLDVRFTDNKMNDRLRELRSDLAAEARPEAKPEAKPEARPEARPFDIDKAEDDKMHERLRELRTANNPEAKPENSDMKKQAEETAVRVGQRTKEAATGSDHSPEDKAAAVSLAAEASQRTRDTMNTQPAAQPKSPGTGKDTSATEQTVKSEAVARDRDVSPEKAAKSSDEDWLKPKSDDPAQKIGRKMR